MRVAGVPHTLSQGQDLGQIKEAVVQAARDGAGMVSVTVVGNRALDVLVTQAVRITFESETVADDARDDADPGAPLNYPNFDEFTGEP